jgi:hypothetical protein
VEGKINVDLLRFDIKHKNNLMLMIKTFTTTNCVNILHQSQEASNAQHMDEKDVRIYESLKPELDKLYYTPSDELIDRILAYSKTSL